MKRQKKHGKIIYFHEDDNFVIYSINPRKDGSKPDSKRLNLSDNEIRNVYKSFITLKDYLDGEITDDKTLQFKVDDSYKEFERRILDK